MCFLRESYTREASSMEKVETKNNKHAVKSTNNNCSDSLVLISVDRGGAVHSNTPSFLWSRFLGKYKQMGNVGHLAFFGSNQGEVNFCIIKRYIVASCVVIWLHATHIKVLTQNVEGLLGFFSLIAQEFVICLCILVPLNSSINSQCSLARQHTVWSCLSWKMLLQACFSFKLSRNSRI